ncbi:MAG: DUF3000 domain-containing protein [Mycobacteriales bacterium]|jgi:hypothetical protein
MSARDEPAAFPAEFRRAVASLRTAPVRPEVVISESPAPARLAPYAVAMTGDLTAVDGDELATGRLIALHDPAGQEGWESTTRLVAYVRAGTDLEMATDPLLPAVGWSWLLDALQARGAAHVAVAGTVTRVASERFGTLAGGADSAAVEVRASWSPIGEDLGAHLAAWSDLLCTAGGLPPPTQGVLPLPARRQRAGARVPAKQRSGPRTR